MNIRLVVSGSVKSASDSGAVNFRRMEDSNVKSGSGEMLESTVEYFKDKIDDHLYKEMELMIEMYESNLTDEEWIEIREFILSHPQHEIVKILRSGVESKGDCRKTEESCS